MIKQIRKKINSLPVIFQLVLLALLGGSISTLSKIALFRISPISFVFLRLLIISIFLSLFAKSFGAELTKSKIKKFLGISTFWWLTLLIYAFGVARTTAITAQFILAFTPVSTALLSTIVLKKGLKLFQWIGVIIATFGVSFIVTNGHTLSFGSNYFLGNMIILFSQIIYAIYLVFSPGKRYKFVSPYEMVLIGALAGSAISLPFAIAETIRTSWWHSVSFNAILATIALGLFSSLFYAAFQVLMKRIGSAVAVVNLYLIPFFGILWAGVLLGERIGQATLIGGIVALTGVAIVTEKNK